MAIWNLGSINADMVYAVPHLPRPGETLPATELSHFLGGKGANMSVAAARAGSTVHHIGAVGPDGRWTVERLADYGVDTRHVAQVEVPTGHAIIAVEETGENLIVLFPGANQNIDPEQVARVLAGARAGDLLVMQNETNAQVEAARMGRARGLKVCYAAAPFDAEAVSAVLPHLDFLILNEVEAEQLQQATDLAPSELPVAQVIVTLGSKGVRYFDSDKGESQEFPAYKVKAVDTTGAGDTFTGYVLAGMDQGMSMPQAIDLAMRAAAIMVTRHGTADVIPSLDEVRQARLD